jgi:MFS family permease
MAAALVLPRVLDRLADRPVMLAGAGLLAAGMLAGPVAMRDWSMVLSLWALLGLGNGVVLTPSGRLLRRSAAAGDRPALFAAQFALSHACWLITYPLAGWLGAAAGLAPTFLLMAAIAALGAGLAARLWPVGSEEAAPHEHHGLAADHPHLSGAQSLPGGGFRHAHPRVVDEFHPSPGR